jgi:hypothetical protein
VTLFTPLCDCDHMPGIQKCLAPSLRVAAKIRPYLILALDGGPP